MPFSLFLVLVLALNRPRLLQEAARTFLSQAYLTLAKQTIGHQESHNRLKSRASWMHLLSPHKLSCVQEQPKQVPHPPKAGLIETLTQGFSELQSVGPGIRLQILFPGRSCAHQTVDKSLAMQRPPSQR